MSKAEERDQGLPDLEGRLMALEQNARGLNARMRAIERSVSGGRQPSQAGACLSEPASDQAAFCMSDIDDYVPAVEITVPYERSEVREAVDTRVDGPENPELPQAQKQPWLKWQPFDATGLIAGLIMILISALLFTGNLETLKNPIIPFAFGVLLIACVCLRRLYR